jgi:glycosyltransferase involved in cell wall biosynthesis
MISIAMATYNGAKYLREQIDSILAQTIQDFELVVCDDCSSDDTWDMNMQISWMNVLMACLIL